MAKDSFFQGAAAVGLLILRIGLGATMMAHGLDKIGAFGSEGSGMAETVARWEQGQGIPLWLGYFALAAEILGGFGLIVGLLGRVAAFGIACTMGVAVFKVHLANGFWNADKGIEFPLILMIAAICLMLTGMGPISIDSRMAKRMDKTITGE